MCNVYFLANNKKAVLPIRSHSGAFFWIELVYIAPWLEEVIYRWWICTGGLLLISYGQAIIEENGAGLLRPIIFRGIETWPPR